MRVVVPERRNEINRIRAVEGKTVKKSGEWKEGGSTGLPVTSGVYPCFSQFLYFYIEKFAQHRPVDVPLHFR
jgi:hypothetical protein